MLTDDIILLSSLDASGPVYLGKRTGKISPAASDLAAKTHGNAYLKLDNVFALYIDGGTLYFQWNECRWPMPLEPGRMTYHHNFDRRTTTFLVDSKQIEYPAWWVDDLHYSPVIPEYDAVEDYLGYIFDVQRDREFLERLRQAWQA